MRVAKSNENYIGNILNELNKLDYIKPDEIPNIDLYMDQVTTFMDEHLSFSKRYDEDKLLTKTMINNYTKNNLLPSPVKKKYSKEHMLLLIFIYYFKNILSINDIQNILNPITDKYFNNDSEFSLLDIYTEIFRVEKEQIDVTTKDVVKKFMKSRETFEFVKDEKEQEFLNSFAFICMLSFDVYVKKQIIERLIDQMQNDKEKDKESHDNKEQKASKDNHKENKENKNNNKENGKPNKENNKPNKENDKNNKDKKEHKNPAE